MPPYLIVILTLICLAMLAALLAAAYYFYLQYQRRKLNSPSEVIRNVPLLPDYGATDGAAYRV